MMNSLEIQIQHNIFFQVKGSNIYAMYSKYKLKHKMGQHYTKQVDILGHSSVEIIVSTTICASA